MNRTDRLLAIILELQAKGTQRAEDLAATFEISKRTVYRDVQALCEAGVPVVAAPGQGYSLLEGYFLPPLSFTIDEAALLLLGSEVMARSFDAEYRAFAQDAARKLAGALPERVREETRRLHDSIRFSTFGTLDNPREEEHLRQLRRAIIRRQTVRLRYVARRSDERETVREVDPFGLVHFAGAWQLAGYCHLRKAIRTFRISRVDALTVLPRTFAPPDFTMDSYLRQRLLDMQDAQLVVVRALFSPEVSRWVMEAPPFFFAGAEESPDGLIVTLRVPREREAVQWLLGWGRHVRVLEPDSLRRLLAEEIEAMRENFKTAESLLP